MVYLSYLKVVVSSLLLTLSLNASSLKPNPQEISKNFKTGDIIFRKEDSFLSDKFEKMDGRGYSHIGIIYFKDKKAHVLHIERTKDTNDLKVDSLKKFLKYAQKYKVLRAKTTINQSILNRQIKKLIKQNPPFDMNFDTKSDDKLYCTELIYKLYKKHFSLDLSKERYEYGFSNFISVGAILHSKELKTIYPTTPRL